MEGEVTVIIRGNGLGHPISNPGWGLSHFTYTLGKAMTLIILLSAMGK